MSSAAPGATPTALSPNERPGGRQLRRLLRRQRVGDVEIEDISEILRFEGQSIWIGLHEPGEDLLRQVQAEFELHDLAVEDGTPRTSGRSSRNTATRSSSSSAPCNGIPRRRSSVRGDARVRRTAVRRLRATRLEVLVRGRAASRRIVAAASETGTGLRALRDHGSHRRPLLPRDRRARGTARGARGARLLGRDAPRGDRAHLPPEARSHAPEARRAAADRGLRPSRPLRRGADPAGHAALLPRHLRPHHPHQRIGRQHARAFDRRAGDEPDARLRSPERGHEEARRLGRDARRTDRDRRHLRHELQYMPSSTGGTATRR